MQVLLIFLMISFHNKGSDGKWVTRSANGRTDERKDIDDDNDGCAVGGYHGGGTGYYGAGNFAPDIIL